uniref:Uncharacterized protein n=1 Tax=Caenorhabditis japonica TaxID=281687 RepID=A0A8R1E929_CAEJA
MQCLPGNPYSTPQLLPHQQFVHHMMHQLPYSAPSYHGGGGGGGGHYPRQDYQTPQRRQGYSRDGPGGGRRGSQRSGRY